MLACSASSACSLSLARSAALVSRRHQAAGRVVRRCQSSTAAAPALEAPPSAAAGNSKSLLFRLLEWYSAKLDSSPLLTKGITGGLIACGGDALCQTVIEASAESKPFDWRRNIRFSAVGAMYIAPGIHYWYGYLATRLAPGAGVAAVAKRVAWDQFVFAPPFIAGFLTALWTLEDPTQNILARLTNTLPDIVQANWVLWIPANCINFGLVPVKFQVLFNNSLGLVWNAYVSYTAQQSSAGQSNSVEDFVHAAVGETEPEAQQVVKA